ncbi:major facilitator superfamily domain-containing protein 6-like [Mugil cephalus]|uniref:major facilitator superfamily domain-containing protein 6-like n=1 Tax=Mugil cephalus TaxID=48193 RepID=UPI001FB77D24|nr:major facilitator superfamily domain-containing protein 6-like [Mugil cephalus]XP_047428327.1 major facilitator superfamily domain-containing protein 6-like [Mugil cephalus]
MRRNRQIDVKRAVALASAFSFLWSGAKACLFPFLTLYFRQLGLSPAMTGVVVGAEHLVSLVWSPVAALLSKHYNKRRVVINVCLVSSAAVALLLLLIPHTDKNAHGACNTSSVRVNPTQSSGDILLTSRPESSPTQNKSLVSQSAVTFPATTLEHTNSTRVMTNISHLENVSVVSDASGESTTSSFSSTPVRRKRFVSEQPQQEEKEEGSFLGSLKRMDAHHQLFFMILFIVSLLEFVSAPLEWTADDGLYEYLDFADASDRHAMTELWRLLGAACGVGGAGLLVSQLSCVIVAQTSRSAVHFYCYASLAVLVLPVAAYLPLYLNKKRDKVNGLLKALQLVYASPRALLCVFTTLLVGFAGSAVENFLLWQMQDHGSSELHMGLSLALALLSQAAFPLLAARVSKLLSPGRVLIVASASLSLQCVYYSFLWGAWAALPAQVLSCFSSGALWWAVKTQCEDVATPGAERSVWRVYSSLSLHLGSGLGSVAGGFVVQRFGLAWLFRGAALVMTVWCVCLPLLQWKAPRQRRINYSRLLAADASEASDTDSDQERDWLDKAMEDDRSNNNNNINRGRSAIH